MLIQTNSHSSHKRNRIVGLDILRTIAILLVLLIHSTYLLERDIRDKIEVFLPAIDGVSVFFVLSGFLIGQIILKIFNSKDLKIIELIHFWIRRWFKTIPSYMLILSILYLYELIVYKRSINFPACYLIFSQNFNSNHPDFFPEAWSLSVEEWFYFLFPLGHFLVLYFTKQKYLSLTVWLLLLVIIPFALRLSFYESDLLIRKIVVFRLDSMMYGILGALIQSRFTSLWQKIKIESIITSIFLFLIFEIVIRFSNTDLFEKVFKFNAESIIVLLSLPYLSQIKKVKFKFLEKGFMKISMMSYAMYLVNLSLVAWKVVPLIINQLELNQFNKENHGLLGFCLFWVLTFLSSFLLYNYFEKPIMALRDKIKLKK